MSSVDEAREALYRVFQYTRHRPHCPEFRGPGDCNCGLYTLLESIRCRTCDHSIRKHHDRDVSDVVGWPCMECASARCEGFR